MNDRLKGVLAVGVVLIIMISPLSKSKFVKIIIAISGGERMRY